MRHLFCAALALQAACAGTFKVEMDERLLAPPDTGAPTPDPSPTPAPDGGSYDLIVDGKDYVVRGVAYSPQHEESCGRIPYYEAVAFDDIQTDAAFIAAAGLNTIRVYSPQSKAIQTDDCVNGVCWIADRHLDALAAAGLKVIITISSIQAFADGLHVGSAQRYAQHPAVLGLQIGNEMNYSHLYSGRVFAAGELVSMANGWADEVRAAGWTKPVILGWGHPSAAHRIPLRGTNADAVAYQLYERLTFRTSNGQSVFDWHRETFDGSLAAKVPSLVTEYGADSLAGDRLDEDAQAVAVGTLLGLVEDDAARGSGTAGGVIFSWADNWGKAAGDACAHDRTGKPGGASGPHPDGIYHEEWWGLVRRDRQPRKAYYRVQEILK